MTSAGASIRQRTSRLAAASFAAGAAFAMLAAPVAHAGANPAASEAWASAAAAAATAPSSSVSALPVAPASDSSAVIAAGADGAASDSHRAAVAPSNLVVTPTNTDVTPPTTAEIPSAGLDAPSAASAAPEPSGTEAAQSPPFTESGEIARYREEQSGMPPPQYSGAMDLRDGQMPTPIGIDLREARRTLKSGEEADGLLIVAVRKGSPAAAAGLRAYNRTAKNVLTGAATVAMLFAPPAMIVLPVIDYMQIGESYDMVIGVDGSRVTNFLDFQDKTRDVQPGELIYLSVVRNGKRLQFVVPVPPNPSQPTN